MNSLLGRDPLTEQVIGFGVAVHRALGPGLLESAYEQCLCFELAQSGMVVQRQVPLPVVYKSVRLDCGYRLNLMVENRLVVEIKSVEKLLPIHDAQILTYLRLSGRQTALLINFNVMLFKDGIRRFAI